MKSTKKAILYGLAVWAIPFVAAFLIFPLRESNRPLFESIMPVVVVAATVLFAKLYLLKVDKDYYKESLKLGVLWLVISLAIDLLMFSRGPWAMSFPDYMSDVGVTYLMIPLITGGFGYLLEKKR